MFRTLRTAIAVTPVALLAACSSGTSAPAETLPAKVDVQVNAVAGDARVSGEQPPRVVLVAGRGATPDVVVVWGSKGTTGSRLLTARSSDGGKTFSASSLVSGADGEGNRGWESVAADSAGRMYVLWLDHRETVMPSAMHHQDGTTTPPAPAPKLDPNEVYTATRSDISVDGSRVGLVEGGTYTVAQLFQGLFLQSGNDCASSLANVIG